MGMIICGIFVVFTTWLEKQSELVEVAVTLNCVGSMNHIVGITASKGAWSKTERNKMAGVSHAYMRSGTITQTDTLISVTVLSWLWLIQTFRRKYPQHDSYFHMRMRGGSEPALHSLVCIFQLQLADIFAWESDDNIEASHAEKRTAWANPCVDSTI